jgi:uncharacterized membrane protein YfcA
MSPTTALLASISPVEIAELVGIGLVAGTAGGLLGIGGGLVMIPAMALVLGDRFGVGSFHVFKLAAITTAIAVSVPAAIRHRRNNAIVPALVWGIVPAALVAAVAGVIASRGFAAEYTYLLKRLFGGFMILVTLRSLWSSWQQQRGVQRPITRCPMATRHTLVACCIGMPCGIIAGLLGVGGGVWAVPAQHLGFGVQLRYAIGNSSVMIVFLAVVVSISQAVSVQSMPELNASSGFILAACLVPGAVAGGWIGAGLTHALPVRALRRAVDVLLLVAGTRLLFAAAPGS